MMSWSLKHVSAVKHFILVVKFKLVRMFHTNVQIQNLYDPYAHFVLLSLFTYSHINIEFLKWVLEIFLSIVSKD